MRWKLCSQMKPHCKAVLRNMKVKHWDKCVSAAVKHSVRGVQLTPWHHGI